MDQHICVCAHMLYIHVCGVCVCVSTHVLRKGYWRSPLNKINQDVLERICFIFFLQCI